MGGVVGGGGGEEWWRVLMKSENVVTRQCICYFKIQKIRTISMLERYVACPYIPSSSLYTTCKQYFSISSHLTSTILASAGEV